MTVLAWAKVRIEKRRTRTMTFTGMRSNRSDNREEYVLRIPGFTGELRKYMTEKEAEEWVIKTNKSAFESAAEASKEGIYGYEEFSKHGSCTGRDMFAAIGRTASRAFGVTKEKK